jgi:glycosyltransferase involved in cell wall biosynthesis
VAAIRRQTYPADRVDILVVDNDSTDATFDVLTRLGVRTLHERSARNSYAARNRALVEATGEILAFTDADCTPSPRWIEAGARCILERGADLVGGLVRFSFDGTPTGAQLWDASTNMQVEANIRDRGVAKTANLFASREVVAAIGPFPVAADSGGDVAWTGRATEAGFSLLFEPAAEVLHPARRLGALARKQLRVGRGQAALLTAGAALRRALRLLLPPRAGAVHDQLHAAGQHASHAAFLRVWVAAWLCRAATGAGILSALPRPHASEVDS